MDKMLFDSHAHLNNESYSQEELGKVIEAIENSSVEYVVDIGFDLQSSAAAVEHSHRYDWCYATVGFHPHNVKDVTEDDMVLLKGLANKPKVVAIGEIGLDYYRNLSPKEDQQYWFRRQIELALDESMPIAIHDRDANQDVMSILKDEGVFGKIGVLLHCYSGSAELAQQYIKLGAKISIAGPVTYKNARRATEVVEEIGLDHLLIETDSPYLTPEPLRGKPNKSPNVEFTARKIGEILDVTYEEVARKTNKNAKEFYRID